MHNQNLPLFWSCNIPNANRTVLSALDLLAPGCGNASGFGCRCESCRAVRYLQLMQTVVVALDQHPVEHLPDSDPGQVRGLPRLVLQGGQDGGSHPAPLPAADPAPWQQTAASPRQRSAQQPRSHGRRRVENTQILLHPSCCGREGSVRSTI